MRAQLVFGGLALSLASWSSACTYTGLEHDVKFSLGSTAPSASELRALVDWYIDKRDGPQGIMETTVYAIWPASEPQAELIAEKRAARVFDLVQALNERDQVPVEKHVRKVDNGPRLPGAFETVTVGTQPVCLKTKSCCGGPVEGAK